jgi:AraC-like DNA-binding protein
MELHFATFLRFFRFRRRTHKKKSFPFNDEKIRQVILQMNSFMELERPYLQTGYTIKSLADELKIPSYRLSALLNEELQKNFNDYLNQYRVSYCKELINQGAADNLNLKGISRVCGFNNRNSFTVAFKKFTGSTPSEYVKNNQHRSFL